MTKHQSEGGETPQTESGQNSPMWRSLWTAFVAFLYAASATVGYLMVVIAAVLKAAAWAKIAPANIEVAKGGLAVAAALAFIAGLSMVVTGDKLRRQKEAGVAIVLVAIVLF